MGCRGREETRDRETPAAAIAAPDRPSMDDLGLHGRDEGALCKKDRAEWHWQASFCKSATAGLAHAFDADRTAEIDR